MAAAIDLTSSAFGAGFLILSAKNAKLLPIFLLIFVMNLELFIINGAIACFFEQIEFFSINPQNGLFGFLNWSDQSISVLLIWGFITGFCG